MRGVEGKTGKNRFGFSYALLALGSGDVLGRLGLFILCRRMESQSRSAPNRSNTEGHQRPEAISENQSHFPSEFQRSRSSNLEASESTKLWRWMGVP